MMSVCTKKLMCPSIRPSQYETHFSKTHSCNNCHVSVNVIQTEQSFVLGHFHKSMIWILLFPCKSALLSCFHKNWNGQNTALYISDCLESLITLQITSWKHLRWMKRKNVNQDIGFKFVVISDISRFRRFSVFVSEFLLYIVYI